MKQKILIIENSSESSSEGNFELIKAEIIKRDVSKIPYINNMDENNESPKRSFSKMSLSSDSSKLKLAS